MKLENISLKARILAAAVLAAALAGCAVGPDYRAPEADSVPAAFKEAAPAGWKEATPSDAAEKGEWWRIYGDALLNELEPQVASANQTVAQYVSRRDRAQALLTDYEASLFPSLSASAGGSRARKNRSTGNTFSLLGSLSWELDLWGKLRRQVTEEKALVEASEADIANAALSAQATLARNYFALRALDARIALYDETIRAYEKNASILKNRYEAGSAVKSDLTQAEQSLYSARASRDDLADQRAATEHAIAVLIGKAPAEFSIAADAKALPAVPEIPAGVPSRLLERRPDIASAERSMAAANEEIGIAVAGYYPDLTLTGEAGYSAGSLTRFINAKNFIWSLGASAAAPIFDAGRTASRVDQARASYEESVASYRQTVLEALEDVEDSLASARYLKSRLANTEAAWKASEETARVKANQYREGMIDYTDVYTTETARLSNAQSVLSLKSEALQNSVTLIESLGGGWTGLENTAESSAAAKAE